MMPIERTQQEMNLHLKERLASAVGGDKVILDFFLPLEKKHRLLERDVEKLLRDFKSAKTYEDFLKLLEPTKKKNDGNPPKEFTIPSMYEENFAQPLGQHITSDTFKKLKEEYEKNQSAYDKRQSAYEKNKDLLLKGSYQKEIQELQKTSALNKSMANLHGALSFFAQKSFGLWVVFGDVNARLVRYQKMADEVDTVHSIFLAQKENCDRQLKDLKEAIAEDMGNLNPSESQKRAILGYHVYLQRTSEELEKRIDDFQHVRDFFYGKDSSGDPLQRDGAIETLQKAISGKNQPAIKFIYNGDTGYEDVPRGERGEGKTSASKKRGESILAHARLIEPIPPGKDRLHYAKIPKSNVAFTIRESVQGDKVEITLEKAPLKSEEEKVMAAMLVVNQLLANGMPSKEEPVTLRGPESKHIYAVLRWANIPHEAIKIGSLPASKEDKKQIEKLVKLVKKVDEDSIVEGDEQKIGRYRQAMDEIKGYTDVKGRVATEITQMLHKVANTATKGLTPKLREDYQDMKTQLQEQRKNDKAQVNANITSENEEQEEEQKEEEETSVRVNRGPGY